MSDTGESVYDPWRCYAVVGNVQTGRQFCGYPAKTNDANGRPVCGVHKKGQHGILWYGTGYRYPEGVGGRWTFAHGKQHSEGDAGS